MHSILFSEQSSIEGILTTGYYPRNTLLDDELGDRLGERLGESFGTQAFLQTPLSGLSASWWSFVGPLRQCPF